MHFLLKFFTYICSFVASNDNKSFASAACEVKCLDLTHPASEPELQFWNPGSNLFLKNDPTCSIYNLDNWTVKRYEISEDAHEEIVILNELKDIDGVARYESCAYDATNFFIKHKRLSGLMSNLEILNAFNQKDT